MKTYKIQYREYKDFKKGSWDQEPDLYIERDENYWILIKRTFHNGNLCGYVSISKTKLRKIKLENLSVHGGITFENDWNEIEGFWKKDTKFLGFDTAHLGDLSPKVNYFSEGVYRDFDYVLSECKKLKAQIKNSKS
jgi:hypothetical protein